MVYTVVIGPRDHSARNCGAAAPYREEATMDEQRTPPGVAGTARAQTAIREPDGGCLHGLSC